MEFKQTLHKLKYSNRYNRSSLSKEILVNIRHVNKTDLLDILELLHDTAEMEFQVKLVSILTAYLLFNNTNRDEIIKRTPLYYILSKILARGLPVKTCITLNFITTLLYAEDDGGSRSRTLTLHAQNLIRSSGCLSAMTHLFTNYMLPTDTWTALCRCLAEVCRGSAPNQNFCSHLVPLCVQRCIHGNPDVLPVLQGLLSNHKRNTHLFMETDGASIFNRKDYLRLEACLQLLTTVVQNADAVTITTMKEKCQIHEHLQDLLKTYSANSNIIQWMTIALYYLDSKLKEPNICYNPTRNHLKNIRTEEDGNGNDTQILLQNIMTEILSHPSQIDGHELPLKHLYEVPHKLSNTSDMSRVVKETELNYNKKKSSEKQSASPYNSSALCNEKPSWSFVMDERLKFNELSLANRIDPTTKLNQTISKTKRYPQSRVDCSQLCDTLKSFNNNCENITDFKPIFVSTPKRSVSNMQLFSLNKQISTKMRSHKNVKNKSGIRKLPIVKKVLKNTSVLQEQKSSIKHRSMSSRLFEAINESCTTVIKSVKNVFSGNKRSDTPKQDTVNTKPDKDVNHKLDCSYSFTNYMQRREAQLLDRNTNRDVSSGMNTLNTVNVCNTCDNTILLEQKLAKDDQLKLTVKKLKLGINLYGCDFKRISKTMWPRETYMTPNVLYNLYRKLLLK